MCKEFIVMRHNAGHSNIQWFPILFHVCLVFWHRCLDKDLWLQMDRIAMKRYFCLWVFGRMTLALPNLNDVDFSDHKSQHWWEWHYSFLFSRSHENGHIWPCFTIQSQGINQSTKLLLILNVLCCSNNMTQKNTSITPVMYKKISIFKVLSNPTKGPVHLDLFRLFASEVFGPDHVQGTARMCSGHLPRGNHL